MRCSASNVCRSLSGLLLLLALAVPSLAQAPTGSVRGAVRDQSDAVLSGATIIISSKGSGAERIFSTKSDGEYQVGSLPPGEYEIKVTMAGFKAGLAPVTVEVGANITVDFKLEVGAASETVVV